MAVEVVSIDTIYIVSGVCGGVILILFCVFLFFCCQPRPPPLIREKDYEASPSHRRAQSLGVPSGAQSTTSSQKPFARVTPTHRASAGFENPAAILSDAIYTNPPCTSRPMVATAPPYHQAMPGPPSHRNTASSPYHHGAGRAYHVEPSLAYHEAKEPSYRFTAATTGHPEASVYALRVADPGETIGDYHTIGLPPPSYSGSLSRRALSVDHLPPSPVASLSVADLPLQASHSRSLHDLTDAATASPVSAASAQKKKKAKKVFYEVVV